MFLLLAACVAPTQDPEAPAPEAPPVRDDDAWEAFRERIEAQVRVDRVPGVQVAIVLGGELAYTEGFGVTQYGGDDPVTADTVFRWASVSKMHTATAFLRLTDAADLDAPVTDLLPGATLDAGFDPATITPRHLMTHSAALPDALTWRCPTRPAGLENYVEELAPPLYAPPGSFYNYSNTGFVWLGAAIEQLSGEPFLDAMDSLVLEPAGMTTATYDAEVAAAGPHATGTTWWQDAPFDYPLEEYDCAWSRPAAWLHGTATDLARTAEWQLAGGGDLLDAAAVTAMHAQIDSHYRPDGSFEVGFGQFGMNYHGADVVWHDGWVTGFVSTWAMVPEADFAVAIVANADWADPYALMYDAIDLFVSPTGADPDYSTDASTWAPYTGTYVDPYVFGTVVVELDGNTLTADFVDLGFSGRMAQSAGDAFYVELEDGSWSDVRFVQDESGTFTWMVQRVGVAARASGAARAEGPPPIDPEAGRAALQRYSRHDPPDASRPIGPDALARGITVGPNGAIVAP